MCSRPSRRFCAYTYACVYAYIGIYFVYNIIATHVCVHKYRYRLVRRFFFFLCVLYYYEKMARLKKSGTIKKAHAYGVLQWPLCELYNNRIITCICIEQLGSPLTEIWFYFLYFIFYYCAPTGRTRTAAAEPFVSVDRFAGCNSTLKKRLHPLRRRGSVRVLKRTVVSPPSPPPQNSFFKRKKNIPI